MEKASRGHLLSATPPQPGRGPAGSPAGPVESTGREGCDSQEFDWLEEAELGVCTLAISMLILAVFA